MSKCECRCGGEASPGKRFISGHNSKVNHPMKGKHHTKESKKKNSDSHKGRTEENDEGVRRGAEKRRGRTKENDEPTRIRAEKYKETCKNPTVAMIEGCKKRSEKMKNKVPTSAMIEGHKRGAEKMTGKVPTPTMIEGRKKQAAKMKGRNKENDEGMRKISETLTGRTKENDEGLKAMSEKLTGRTKETHEGVRRAADALRGRTKENYEYIRKTAEASANRIGEKSSGWKGGISFAPYCEKFDDEFKERVREYFGRCCYICGKSEQEQIDEMIKEGKRPLKRLDVHHVNYNKMVCCNDVKPLFVPLCRSCHSKTHGNREYWEEFLTISLKCLTKGECFTKK